MAGRKQGSVFIEHGFESAKINGKYLAICTICNKKLQNTASARLLKHRNVCKLDGSHSLPEKPGSEVKRTNSQTSIKLKEELNENYEDEIQFDNNLESTLKEKGAKTSYKDDKESSLYDEQVKNIQDYVAENPLSPAYKNSLLNAENYDIAIEDEEIFLQKLKQNKLSDKQIKLRSRKLLNLQEEKTRAETFYFRKKGEFFQKQTENLDIQRKLMILQAQKLRLEIENIRNDF